MTGTSTSISCVGINHTSAPVELRERVSFSGDLLAAALSEIGATAGVEQCVLLSTCNRTEIYTVSDDQGVGRVRSWLRAKSGLPDDFFSPHVYTKVHREAAFHLCCVAAGIDSQVLGESEILGQVKAAAQAAKEAGALGAELRRLFAVAVRAGRRARTDTGIGRGAFSIGRCAAETAKTVLAEIRGRAVLILGAGKMAESTARHLWAQGANPLLVANRTHLHAERLAAELGGRALRYDQLIAALQEVDIVIASTSAPHFVILPEQISEVMAQRGGRDLFLVDIAVPRDIDPGVAKIEGVHLYDIDDLSHTKEAAAGSRAAAREAARDVAQESADEFVHWLAARRSAPLLRALQEHFECVQQAQLTKFASKLDRLPASERAWVEDLLRSTTNRLLHDVIIALKQGAAGTEGRGGATVAGLSGLASGPETDESPSGPAPGGNGGAAARLWSHVPAAAAERRSPDASGRSSAVTSRHVHTAGEKS